MSIEVKSSGSSPKLLSTTLYPRQNNESFQTWSNYNGYDGYDTVTINVPEARDVSFIFGDYGPQFKSNEFGLALTNNWYTIDFNNDVHRPCCSALTLWFYDVSSSASVTIHFC